MKNLCMILFSQGLFFGALVTFSATTQDVPLHQALAIMFSYVCIAAAGYIINDLFDVNIDLVNKPGKVLIGKVISRKMAYNWYAIFNLLGFIFSLYVAILTKQLLIGVAAILVIGFLYWYSAQLKKSFLWGNILVAGISAWSLTIMGFFAGHVFVQETALADKILWVTIIYTLFAFITSLIREVVKDVEDLEGDQLHGCTTMPVIWGLAKTKAYIYFLFTTLIVLLFGAIAVTAYLGWWILTGYSILLSCLVLALALVELKRARTPAAFSALSGRLKWLMLAGTLSLFYFIVETN